MSQLWGARVRPRRSQEGILLLAVLLVLPTIGLEQLLHTTGQAIFTLPLYQLLHWLSDSLLALPLGVVAVWSGQRLAARFGIGTATLSDMVSRAGLIAVLFALLLVPGAAFHDAADRLTHVHATLSIHAHGSVAPPGPAQTAVPETLDFTAMVVHGLADGFEGQAIGLPLMILAMWELRRRGARARRLSRTHQQGAT